MKTYTIVRQEDRIQWDSVPTLSIDTVLWLPAAPISAKAQVCYTESALHVCLTATEPNIRAEESGPLGQPCNDSCLEFFFSPVPTDSRYFNIECNPNGCIYLGFGSDRYNLVRLIPEKMPIVPQISRTSDGWRVEYSVPYTFIRQFFPEFSPVSGSAIRANFYKCGDETVQPHYLSWNPVELVKPDFHRPDFFASMYFE